MRARGGRRAALHRPNLAPSKDSIGTIYGTSCSVVLNKKGPLNSVRSPAFFPATGCKRADKGLFHFHASDATSPKMRAS